MFTAITMSLKLKWNYYYQANIFFNKWMQFIIYNIYKEYNLLELYVMLIIFTYSFLFTICIINLKLIFAWSS